MASPVLQPLFIRFCFQVLGIALVLIFPLSSGVALFSFGGLTGLNLLLLAARRRRVLLHFNFVLLGLVSSSAALEQKERLLGTSHRFFLTRFLPGSQVWIEGYVEVLPIVVPRRGRESFQWSMRMEKILLRKGADSTPLPRGLRAWVENTSPLLEIGHGDRIRTVGRVFPVLPHYSPKGENRKSNLLGIEAALKIFSGPGENVKILSKRKHFSLRSFLLNLNSRISIAYETYCSSEFSSVLRSLLLGHNRSLPYSIRKPLVQSGVLHFFAISGLHFGLFLGILWTLLMKASVPRRATLFLLLAFIPCFAIFTGLRCTVLRAGIMAFIVISAKILRRRISPLHALGGAGILILLFRPLDLFTAGFLLSFSSVLGILLFFPVLHRILFLYSTRESHAVRSQLPGRLLQVPFRLLALSLAAFLGNFPITLAFFHLIAPISSVSTLLLSPFILVFMLTGIILPPLAYSYPQGAEVAANMGSLFYLAFRGLVLFFSSLPLSHLYFPPPSPVFLFLYFSFFSLSGIKKRISLVIPFVFLFYKIPLPSSDLPAAITFLNPFRGHAVAVSLSGRSNVLLLNGSWAGLSGAEEMVAASLSRLNIRHLDLLIPFPEISPFGREIKTILERIPTKRVITNGELRKVADARFPGGKGVSIQGLWNGNGKVLFVEVRKVKQSPSRFAVLFEIKGRRVLLLGPLREDEAVQILKNPMVWQSDLLQISRLPQDREILSLITQKVRPRFLVVTGKENPRRVLLESYSEEVEVFIASWVGRITFHVQEDGLECTPFSD